MKGFLVISSDNYLQQTFHDFVESDTPENAKAMVAEARPGAIPVGAYSADDLLDLVWKLQTSHCCDSAEELAAALTEAAA